MIEYLVDDPETTLIACFVEALRDGPALRRARPSARRRRKPVVVLKGGRSDAGRRAAGSHTGSLAGSYDVFRAACVRARVVLAEETEEFFDAIETLVAVGAPAAGARRASRSSRCPAGPSVVAADTAERAGLAVPALGADDARRRCAPLLPPFAAVGNPVDLTPQVEPARIDGAIRAVMAEPAIAGAVAVNVGLDIPAFAEARGRGGARDRQAGRRVHRGRAARSPRCFHAGGVPVLPSPERAVRAWRALWQARPRTPAPRAIAACRCRPISARAATTPRRRCPYGDARRLLEAYGVRFCRERTAASVDEAVAAADAHRLSRRRQGGRAGGSPTRPRRAASSSTCATPTACARRARRCARAPARRACVVQERVGPGRRAAASARGATRSSVPSSSLGTGGVLTEVAQDVSVRLAPVDDEDDRGDAAPKARDRGCSPVRAGCAPVDRAALVGARPARGRPDRERRPRVSEIDLNPVIARGRRRSWPSTRS